MNKMTLDKKTYWQEYFPYTTFADLPLYEQRYIPRFQIDNKAYYREGSLPAVRTQIKDLSASGVCLHTEPNINVNQRLKLKIYLSEITNFEADGTVVWTSITPEGICHAGIVFDPLPEKTHAMLLEYSFLMK